MINLSQAGGHQLIKPLDKKIIKPTKYDELEFYRDYLPKYQELHNCIPKFYGGGNIDEVKNMFNDDEYNLIINKKYEYYVILENLIDNNKIDSIIDIKLGSIHWKKNTSINEITEHKLRNVNSLTEQYGFRLDGIINNTVKYMKENCRNMKIQQIIDIIYHLNYIHIQKIKIWINKIINILKKINLNLYGPSLLIIISNSDIKINLIDFAVFEESDDHNHDLIESLQNFGDVLSYVMLKKEN
ncbi:hypothetical protein Indivirus_2_111 [Indivirus ILV1]|uniref:Kinase n=1 Tax=Indivirus ILV1 TaxID=1977633 RepID=A0A1V0SDE4_9VIRU|nr:hypothetical protein Indivirus_2_111 [Indivirus ILV1]